MWNVLAHFASEGLERDCSSPEFRTSLANLGSQYHIFLTNGPEIRKNTHQEIIVELIVEVKLIAVEGSTRIEG